MAEPKKNTGGGTMIADSPPKKGPPPPPPPPPRAQAGSGTVVAESPPPAPAAAAGGGGTMIAAGDAVPPPVATQNSGPQGPADLCGVTLLGRYHILKKLGEGGMGTVYLGEHTTIKKKFAIKVLSHEFAHKEDLVERFLQEARAASMISQENVVEITDFGDTPDGSVFFVMEHLAGEDLSDTVKNTGPLPWRRIKPIMLQICRALQAAHDVGIIHRDMKPENCFRIKRGSNDDFIKVLDFGIAKVTSEEGESGGKGLTRTGMIFGTPEYMSPEQAQGAKPDHRVDVYAAGVILYELLTGNVPFTADTFMGILTKHMFEVPEAPSQTAPPGTEISPDVEAIVLKAMQKDREYRFQSMDEMAEAILEVGSGTAVEVVHENIARPGTGEMAFSGGHVPVTGGTMPPVTGEAYPPKKSNMGMVLGIVGGIVLLFGGLGGAYAMGLFGGGETEVASTGDGKGEDEGPKEDEVVKAPEPEVTPEVTPEPEPEPEVQKVLAPEVPKVKFNIKTPFEAKILDAADHGIYGKTNTEDGVVVEKSKKPLKLILRADGFEDHEFEIIPNRDKTFEIELKKLKKVTKPVKKKKPTGKKKPDPKTEKPEKPAARPVRKPRRGKGSDSPDLKDPFNR